MLEDYLCFIAKLKGKKEVAELHVKYHPGRKEGREEMGQRLFIQQTETVIWVTIPINTM